MPLAARRPCRGLESTMADNFFPALFSKRRSLCDGRAAQTEKERPQSGWGARRARRIVRPCALPSRDRHHRLVYCSPAPRASAVHPLGHAQERDHYRASTRVRSHVASGSSDDDDDGRDSMHYSFRVGELLKSRCARTPPPDERLCRLPKRARDRNFLTSRGYSRTRAAHAPMHRPDALSARHGHIWQGDPLPRRALRTRRCDQGCARHLQVQL